MKVSKSSQRKLSRKVVQLEHKTKELQEKNKSLSKEIRSSKKRIKYLESSRANWKAKNKSKSKKIKGLTKQIKSRAKVNRHHYPVLIIALCIQLRTQAGCSYRGICKILKVLTEHHLLEMEKIPCANSIENWVSKMGYYCIKNVSESLGCKEHCLILDESINKGNERTLLMLLTAFDRQKEQPLTFEDVRVCYLSGQTSWTGEQIKTEVTQLMEQEDVEIKMLLSDQDSKLLKAGRLLDLPHLPDISHGIATCLKKTFSKQPSYQALIKQISAYQAKSVNQKLSYLHPPKQRVKARFMNQKGFVKWAEFMIEKFDTLNQKEQAFFSELPEHQPILNLLGKCIELAEQIEMILKNKGLSSQTIKEVEQIMFKQWFISMNFIPITVPIQTSDLASLGSRQTDYSIPFMISQSENEKDLFGQFLKHLKVYIDKYKEFLTTNQGVFNVSSDIIESFFGKYKKIKANNQLVGVSQIDLELPVYCIGSNQIKDLTKIALEATFGSDLRKFIDDNSSDNQASRRAKFFKNGT